MEVDKSRDCSSRYLERADNPDPLAFEARVQEAHTFGRMHQRGLEIVPCCRS